MHILRLLVLVSIVFISCNQAGDKTLPNTSGVTACNAGVHNDSLNTTPSGKIRGALLGTRFTSLQELKSVIQMEYHVGAITADSMPGENSFVSVRHCSNGREVVAMLATGTSQGDIYKAGYSGSIVDRLRLLFRCPYAVINRKDLERIYDLSRWNPEKYGGGDLAFLDLAKAAVENINTPELALINVRDTTEKGYFNSFNHMTAQAFITSCFSEVLADFIADAHERHNHPELISGKFTEAQILDLKEGPVDNYVDIINNEWGQELGKQLKAKYSINSETNWTPTLLADYMNDLQRYYSWAFQIGFKPFRPEDERVRRFSSKIQAVMYGR